MATVRAKALLRLSFGGGGTDVPPYPEERGGGVLSATIDKYAYCSLATRADDSVNVVSLDYNLVARYSTTDNLDYDGKLDPLNYWRSKF